MLEWFRGVRERRRERLAAGRRPIFPPESGVPETVPAPDVSPTGTDDEPSEPQAKGSQPAAGPLSDLLAPAKPVSAPARPKNGRSYAPPGQPLNRQSPFYVGFVGAIGVLAAYGLIQAVARLDTVLTLLLVAFFLTLALNPLVEFLMRRSVRRGWSVTIVFLGAVFVFTLVGFVVVPTVTLQGTELATRVPTYVEQLLANPWVQDVDQHYGVIAKIQEEINNRLLDGGFISQVAGGVLGAGLALASGIFSTLTVLILTLYFLASLPALKSAAYALVPASRRTRVVSLSEEVMRRVGNYAIGQVVVAAVNAFFSYVMMLIVGIPYAAVLAVAVGFLGLVPMVGATLGAVLVGTVALFDEPRKAIIAIIYYIVYQQLENYAVMPRIMQRTVSVPGAVTVVAALTGGTLLGALGALLAIPAAAGFLLIYEEVVVPRQERH